MNLILCHGRALFPANKKGWFIESIDESKSVLIDIDPQINPDIVVDLRRRSPLNFSSRRIYGISCVPHVMVTRQLKPRQSYWINVAEWLEGGGVFASVLFPLEIPPKTDIDRHMKHFRQQIERITSGRLRAISRSEAGNHVVATMVDRALCFRKRI